MDEPWKYYAKKSKINKKKIKKKRKYYAELKKPDTKDHMLYDYMGLKYPQRQRTD